MKATLETKIVSNLLLTVDHCIQQAGSAFTNHNSLFYPVSSDMAGYYAYASPFKGLCNDVSVDGATVISGLYVNGVYTPIGSGNLSSINHYKGVAYFSSPLASHTIVSGNYAVKDFSIALADQPEWRLMFETKHVLNNSIAQVQSGFYPTDRTAPIIYLIPKTQTNDVFGFNHIDNGVLRVRAVIIADTEFQAIGAGSILKNLKSHYLPMFTSTPFDVLGNNTGIVYNFKNVTQDYSYRPLIREAQVIDLSQKGDFQDIPKNLSMVDFTIETVAQNAVSLP